MLFSTNYDENPYSPGIAPVDECQEDEDILATDSELDRITQLPHWRKWLDEIRESL